MKKRYSILIAAAGIALLTLAGLMSGRLSSSRSQGRPDSVPSLDNAPPMMVFTTVVLGGFRGLMADVLWLRATNLQEEGRYFELATLSDWIARLEPRATEIWAFHAWNLAYNISVVMSQPEERWKWVKKGLELLIDDGLRYNPKDAQLHWEIGWLFQHKLGGTSDKAHEYYKEMWRREMNGLFKGPRPDYEGLEKEPWLADRMKDEYRLEPGLMKELEKKYGPLDWRLPRTHSLYWAARGLRHARGTQTNALNKMIDQSLKQLESE